MADHAVRSWPEITPAPGAKLEPDAIGAAQDTIIGMASSAPAATVATIEYLILIGLAIAGLVWVLSLPALALNASRH